MANICSNSLTAIGSPEALLQLSIVLGQQLRLSLVEGYDIRYVSPTARYSLPSGTGDASSIWSVAMTSNRASLHEVSGSKLDFRGSPLDIQGALNLESFIYSPLRYLGLTSFHWSAPFVTPNWGFDVQPGSLNGSVHDSHRVQSMTFSFSSKWSPTLDMVQSISRLCPHAVLVIEYSELGNGVLGAVAYLDGRPIIHYDHAQAIDNSPDSSADSESDGAGSNDDDAVDEAEYIDPDDDDSSDLFEEQGLEAIKEKVIALAESVAEDLLNGRHPSSGSLPAPIKVDQALLQSWSKPWDDAACVAYGGGLDDIRDLAVAHLAESGIAANESSFQNLLGRWVQESRRARAASWLDSYLFCQEDLSDLLGESIQPGEDPPSELITGYFTPMSPIEENFHRLLAECSKDTEFSRALVGVLSDPGTRLITGLHPVSFLSECARSHVSGDVHRGIKKICDAMAERLSSSAYDHLRSEASLVGKEWLKFNSKGEAEQAIGISENNLFSAVFGAHTFYTYAQMERVSLTPSSREGINGINGQKLASLSDEELREATLLYASNILGSSDPNWFRGTLGESLNPDFKLSHEDHRLLESILYAGIQCCEPATRLALACGFDPRFILRSQLLMCPADAVAGFESIHGGITTMPKEFLGDIQQAVACLGDRQTESMLQSQITYEQMMSMVRQRVAESRASNQDASKASDAPVESIEATGDEDELSPRQRRARKRAM